MADQVLIVGQSYVGLPLAMRCVDVGFDVTGLDIDDAKVDRLMAGTSYVEDVTEDQLPVHRDLHPCRRGLHEHGAASGAVPGPRGEPPG